MPSIFKELLNNKKLKLFCLATAVLFALVNLPFLLKSQGIVTDNATSDYLQRLVVISGFLLFIFILLSLNELIKTIKKGEIMPFVINGAIIFILDAFIINQGAIALITVFIVITIFLPYAIYNHFIHNNPKKYYLKCLIYLFASVMVFGANYINNKIANHRAVELVAIIEKYKQDNGHYPEKLDSLVPKYLISVPLAKFTLAGKFFYLGGKTDPILFYIDLPPFGRRAYHFEQHEWKYFD